MSARESAALALACACAALLLSAARADAAPAKREESEFMSPMPFVLGSRYGRSQPRMMSPRNDRFFMGSRYGKRSDPALLAPRPLAPAPARARALYCEYTGVYRLYRCNPRGSLENRSLENRRLEDKPFIEDE